MYMTSIQQKNHSKNHNFITDIVTYMYIVAQDSFIVYTMYMYMYIQYMYMHSVRVHVPFCVPWECGVKVAHSWVSVTEPHYEPVLISWPCDTISIQA